MKKIVVLCIAMMVAVAMVGCGSDKPEKGKATKEETKNPPVGYFKDNIAEIEDVKIEITDVKVIPAGNPGNEYGEKSLIVFYYKTTNKTDKDIDPMSAWMAVFTAYQDNDKNRLNELRAGHLEDERFYETATETIKKGGTVEGAEAYELDDETTPVLLKATKGVAGAEIGSKEYDIK